MPRSPPGDAVLQLDPGVPQDPQAGLPGQHTHTFTMLHLWQHSWSYTYWSTQGNVMNVGVSSNELLGELWAGNQETDFREGH